MPLNVTSCGLNSAILSQKAVINSFSVLSPTWGAPTASTELVAPPAPDDVRTVGVWDACSGECVRADEVGCGVADRAVADAAECGVETTLVCADDGADVETAGAAVELGVVAATISGRMLAGEKLGPEELAYTQASMLPATGV